MGYTHYFNFTKEPKNIENGLEKFHNAVELFKKGLSTIGDKIKITVAAYDCEGHYLGSMEKEMPFSLKGGDGKGEPVITDTMILFNGDESHNQLAETFCLSVDYKGDFCKTCRRTYDVACCLVLRCMKHYFGDDFCYSSDGDINGGEEGWGTSKEIFDALIQN